MHPIIHFASNGINPIISTLSDEQFADFDMSPIHLLPCETKSLILNFSVTCNKTIVLVKALK